MSENENTTLPGDTILFRDAAGDRLSECCGAEELEEVPDFCSECYDGAGFEYTCPVCHEPVEDDDDAIAAHLTSPCGADDALRYPAEVL